MNLSKEHFDMYNEYSLNINKIKRKVKKMIIKVFSLIIIFYLSHFVSDNAIDFLCLIITLYSLPVFLKYNSLLRIRCVKFMAI